MPKKPSKSIKQPTEDIKKEITKVCEEIVLKEEIVKMRDGALQELEQAKAQLIFWDTRIKQLTGSLASFNLILQKTEKPKSLVLQNNHKPDEKKNEQPIRQHTS